MFPLNNKAVRFFQRNSIFKNIYYFTATVLFSFILQYELYTTVGYSFVYVIIYYLLTSRSRLPTFSLLSQVRS
jgi:hypothetical protein